MERINFSKVVGSGNDFVVIDNRNSIIKRRKDLILR